MAQRLQELCTALVEDVCGRLCSTVFSTLAENGRLSRPQLQQHTRIPGRQLRHVLTSMTQLHILLYNSNDDGESTFYQIDWRNTYALLRSSRVIDLVEYRFGESASKIVANVLQLGHARVGDLAEAFDFPSDSMTQPANEATGFANGGTQVNGVHSSGTSSMNSTAVSNISQFHALVLKLLRSGFLVKVVQRTYLPAADFQSELEEAVIVEQFPDRKISGPKKQAEFQSAVNSLKRKWREADEFSQNRDMVSSIPTIHASNSTPQPTTKRQKTVNGIRNASGGETGLRGSFLSEDLVVRVNYARCVLALRSHQLERLAEPYLGSVTAAVYGALLQALEGKLSARDEKSVSREDPEDEEDALPVATTREIAELVDTSIDLAASIHGAYETYNIKSGPKPPKKVSDGGKFADLGIKEEYDSDHEDNMISSYLSQHADAGDQHVNQYSSYEEQNKHLSLVEDHLKLLAEHSMGFCRRVGGGGRGEWRVHFPNLSASLVEAEIDATVLTRFGKVHARILRLLREKGKLEEKHIAAIAMMRLKDVRPTLTELQFDGLVECQEVPKDATRQNARTIFLWFHHQPRVQALLLHNTYQGMSRLLQRLRVERDRNATVIDRAEMLDTRHESLNQNEQQSLVLWRESEEKLLTQLLRMDDLVALLRDFSGHDTSLIS